jgi:hypothetical protein
MLISIQVKIYKLSYRQAHYNICAKKSHFDSRKQNGIGFDCLPRIKLFV